MKGQLFFLLIIAQFAWSQSIEVSGTVKDVNGPLPGANVVLKGTTIATHTNFDGYFTLKVPSANSILVISYFGYVTKEIIIDPSRLKNEYTLEEDDTFLEEIVYCCFGLPRYLALNYFGGLNHSKYGASIKYQDPYLFGLPFTPRLELGYQTNNKGNKQVYTELELDDVFYAYPIGFGVNISHSDIDVDNLIDFKSWNLEVHTSMNLIFRRNTALITGVGTSNFKYNTVESSCLGLIIGISQNLPFGITTTFKSTYWSHRWQLQGEVGYRFKDIYVLYRYNSIENYTEHNVGIGYQFYF